MNELIELVAYYGTEENQKELTELINEAQKFELIEKKGCLLYIDTKN